MTHFALTGTHAVVYKSISKGKEIISVLPAALMKSEKMLRISSLPPDDKAAAGLLTEIKMTSNLLRKRL